MPEVPESRPDASQPSGHSRSGRRHRAQRHERRVQNDQSEVSLCIKYLLFGFNVIFWLLGAMLIGISAWAWQDKGAIDNFGSLTGTAWLDPILIILIIGIVVFVIGFFGCVGALRENTILLTLYYSSLGIILLAMIIIGILIFAFKGQIEERIKNRLLDTVVKYREDPDLQFLIDWVQKDWLRCCGVNGPDDWDMNIYFNCTSPSRESCGVPFSCCRNPEQEKGLVNTQCGYDSRQQGETTTVSEKIWTDGCVEAGKTWLNRNILPIAGVLVGVALLQILGICFAQNLRSDILAQKAKWR